MRRRLLNVASGNPLKFSLEFSDGSFWKNFGGVCGLEQVLLIILATVTWIVIGLSQFFTFEENPSVALSQTLHSRWKIGSFHILIVDYFFYEYVVHNTRRMWEKSCFWKYLVYSFYEFFVWNRWRLYARLQILQWGRNISRTNSKRELPKSCRITGTNIFSALFILFVSGFRKFLSVFLPISPIRQLNFHWFGGLYLKSGRSAFTQSFNFICLPKNSIFLILIVLVEI